MSDLNLYQRRNLAKKAVFEHEFSKIMGEGLKYKYLPVEQIKPVVEKAWNDAGIVMDPGDMEEENVREPWDVQSQYGTSSRWYHVKGKVSFTLVNIDDPSDKVTFVMIGEAKDNSDKTYNKVYTSALKNFYKMEFNISEGPKDDTDSIQSDDQLEKEIAPVVKRRSPPANDPFFGKQAKTETKDDFVTGDKIAISDEIPTEAEMVSVISVKGAQAKYKEVVKKFKIEKGAKSNYDLTYNDKVELYTILMAIDGSDRGAGA